MAHLLARAILILSAAASAVGTIAAFAAGDPISGTMLVGVVLVLVAALVLERTRYRSLGAEASSAPPGPGGGELTGTPLEARFRPTDEVFEDPVTRVGMRVHVDPSTGERRYRVEG